MEKEIVLTVVYTHLDLLFSDLLPSKGIVVLVTYQSVNVVNVVLVNFKRNRSERPVYADDISRFF